MPEHEPSRHPEGTNLPREMAEYLKTQEYAAFFQGCNHGTVLMVRIPRVEIESVRGSVPIHLQHSLIEHPLAPVVRSTVRIFDRPDSHLALETYTNVADPVQRDEFAGLGQQEHLLLLFYDATLTQQFVKRIRSTKPEDVAKILALAEELRDRIPKDRYDFDAAKAAVIAATQL